MEASTFVGAAESGPSSKLQQRWARFVGDDAPTVAISSGIMSAIYLAKEYRAAGGAMHTAGQRLQRATRKTTALLPMVVFSTAVGIMGMNMTISAVQEARRDYTRSSIKVALPLFAALMHAPRGPRSMAKSAIGYGAFIYGADYFITRFHRAQAAEEMAAERFRVQGETTRELSAPLEFVSEFTSSDSTELAHVFK